MPDVYVAVGSNVDPRKNLAVATRELVREFPGTRLSSWYQNRAVGFEGEDFINCVAGFPTDLAIREVIERLQAIEALCGRTRDAPRWAPRSMDLDILLYGDRVCDEPRLKLPRPDLLKRAYMLGPLAELAPHVIHPTERVTIAELWERFDRAAHPMQKVAGGPATSPHSDPRRPPESAP